MDSREDEQERGITMEASGISLLFQHAEKEYLVNLVDSPGHVDFSSDVSTAVRLCDGALVLVDVVEGVGYQTHAVLRQAWEERLKPCLVLNKIDRLITELKMDPVEATEHLHRIVEQVNSIVLAYFSAAVIGENDKRPMVAEDEELNDAEEEALTFAPERGNVVFASAVDNWAFRISDFVPLISERIGLPRKRVQKCLWGNYFYNSKTGKVVELKSVNTSVTRGESSKSKPPMFATFILESIWQIYGATVIESKPKKLEKIISMLNLQNKVIARDISKGGKAALRSVMGSWLPVTKSILSMVVRCVPDPIAAQRRRIEILWPESSIDPEYSLTRKSIENCSSEGPLVLFVSKMFAVPERLVPLETAKQLKEWNPDIDSREIFFAFARVFSGTVTPGVPVYVLGPKYVPSMPQYRSYVGNGLLPLLIMGADLMPLQKVPAGNIVALAGLDQLVLKTATITSSLHCHSLSKMPSQSAPILRVSIEPVNPLEWDKLAEGLRLLNRADPVAEVRVLPNGEHVIGAIGELHMERCVKDLRDRFAGIELKVSAPIAVFRETLVAVGPVIGPLGQLPPSEHTEEISPGGVVVASVSGGFIEIQLRAIALPDVITRALEDNAEFIRKANMNWESTTTRRSSKCSSSMESSVDEVGASRELYSKLEPAFSVSSEWNSRTLDRIWAISDCGPNLLINAISERKPGSSESLFLQDEEYFNSATETVLSALTSGFQLGCRAGPLCEEPLWGVAFVVQDIIINDDDRDALALCKQKGDLSGQVIVSVKDAMFRAFDLHHLQYKHHTETGFEVRLAEGFLRCGIQCHVESYEGDTLGKLYGVLSKRRSKVESEDLWEGTSIFTVNALIPIVESFNFGDELRRKTSGAASTPQMLFSHWEIIPENPFFRASTDDELEEFGEHQYEESYSGNNLARRFITQVRTRKGMETQLKIVVAAEKQRTLGKNK